MTQAVISLERVSKYYKLYNDPRDRLKEALHPFKKEFHSRHFALDDISLEVNAGEVLGIVGRNGSGKSTFLKVIAGVLQPNSGSLTVNGQITALLELGAGFNPEFTGLENVSFYGRVLGISPSELVRLLPEIVEFAALGEYMNQPVKSYSSGMKARLGFSVAVHVDPEILILDEVLAVGDALFKRKCYAKMDEFFRSGKTILYVSHDANSVNRLCSRAILIEKGKLLLDGDPREVTKEYDKLLFADASGVETTTVEDIKESNGEVEQSALTAVTHPSTESSGDLLEPYLIPGFVPQSTVVYPSETVLIEDVAMTTCDGEPVNVLVTGDYYIYQYRVKFREPYQQVSFGMRILTEQGVQLTGASGVYNNHLIERVAAGAEYVVKWRFRCNLLSGVYFTNAGVSEHISDEYAMLARHLDAMVFKVITPKDIFDMSRIYLDLSLGFEEVASQP